MEEGKAACFDVIFLPKHSCITGTDTNQQIEFQVTDANTKAKNVQSSLKNLKISSINTSSFQLLKAKLAFSVFCFC